MKHLDDVPPRRGLVIFLNGTSSSGKSSIATELLRTLEEPCFHMPVDAFHAMRSRTPSRRTSSPPSSTAPGRAFTARSRAWPPPATTSSSTTY